MISLDLTHILGAASALVFVITTLGGAVGHLYRTLAKINKTTRDELKQCHVQHQAANDHIIELSEKVGKLSGAQEMADKIIEAINNLQTIPRRRSD